MTVKMVTLDFKIKLPDRLRKQAERADLLSPEAIERLLCEELRRQRLAGFFDAANRLAGLDIPPLTEEEIEAEIRLARKPTGA
jgi:hypothetical protein